MTGITEGNGLRIGIVAPEFPPAMGGVENYAYEFSRELARRGHSVTVFTVKHDGGEVDLPGVRIVPSLKVKYHQDKDLFSGYEMDVWHVMNAAYSWLSLETRPVVVSVHGNDFLSQYCMVGKLNLHSFRGAWRFHAQIKVIEDWVGKRYTSRLIKRGLLASSHIIANSRYTEKILLEHYPACKGRTSVGFVGVSEYFFQVKHSGTREGRPAKLITVARLSEPRKNVDKVLYALSKLRQKHDFTYTVIGNGPSKAYFERLGLELGLEDRVHFLGVISKQELGECLGASDLYILTSSIMPSSFEGFGISYLEANACGTPVLAARLGGASEAVKEGVSGMFVEDVSVPAIAEALEKFLSGKLRFDSDSCRTFARQFSWARVVDHALNYYNKEGV